MSETKIKAGHEVRVGKLPQCDLCKNSLAQYDCKTVYGPWAYACGPCFRIHGIGTGVGLGQRLVLA